MKSINILRMAMSIIFFIGLTFTANAQSGKAKSPAMDASHTIGALTIDIKYNAPSVRGRKIWGELVPYNKVWRTGANGATTFSINKDVLINGEKLAAGKYAFFTIPTEDTWTIIFNKEANQWGAYNYNENDDVLRLKIQSGKAPEFTEQLTFEVGDNDENIGVVSLLWENLKTGFNIIEAK